MLAGTVNRLFDVARPDSLLTPKDRWFAPPVESPAVTATSEQPSRRRHPLRTTAKSTYAGPAESQKETKSVNKGADLTLTRRPIRKASYGDASPRVEIQTFDLEARVADRGSDEATRDPLSEIHGGHTTDRISVKDNRSRLAAGLARGLHSGGSELGRNQGKVEKRVEWAATPAIEENRSRLATGLEAGLSGGLHPGGEGPGQNQGEGGEKPAETTHEGDLQSSLHFGGVEAGQNQGEGEEQSAETRHGGEVKGSLLPFAKLGALVEGGEEPPKVGGGEELSLSQVNGYGTAETVEPSGRRRSGVGNIGGLGNRGWHEGGVEKAAGSAEAEKGATAQLRRVDFAEAGKVYSFEAGKVGRDGAVAKAHATGTVGDSSQGTHSGQFSSGSQSGEKFEALGGSRSANVEVASVSGRTPETTRRMSDTARRKAKLKAAVSQAKTVEGALPRSEVQLANSGLANGGGSAGGEGLLSREGLVGGEGLGKGRSSVSEQGLVNDGGLKAGRDGRTHGGLDLPNASSFSDFKLSDGNGVVSKGGSRRGQERGWHSDGPESSDSDGESLDPADWFDGADLSDSEALDDTLDITSAKTVLTEADEIIAPTEIQTQRGPRGLTRQVSAGRQTADVSAHLRTTRVATSRILEASDYDDVSSLDFMHWEEGADVAPSVSIYGKQPGGFRGEMKGGIRPPWKRERHKAKTHENHRRRALERKSQLASAGLSEHLEAEEKESESVEPEKKPEPERKSPAYTYSGMRCEVCRRQRKGGCGTVKARPQCLKRLLLYPQMHVPPMERESESVPSEEAPADALRKSLGLSARARPMVRYLTSLGFTEEDLERLTDKNVSTFRLTVGLVKARVNFFKTLGVESDGLRAMVHKHPTVLRYRIDRVLQTKVNFLKRLGVPEDAIAGVITSHPGLLGLRLTNLEPKVQFLTQTLGIPLSKVVDMVCRQPQVLEKSIRNGLQPRADYFLKEVGVPPAAFAKMVSRHPQLLQYSIEKGIKPRMEFLRAIGLTADERIECITKFPPLLSLSVYTCFRPKYEYLISQLGGTKKTVVDFPAYFSLSLDNRIIPRFKELSQLDRGGAIPTSVLMLMLRLTDEDFAAELDKGRAKKGAKSSELRKKTIARGFGSKRKGRSESRITSIHGAQKSMRKEDIEREEEKVKDAAQKRFFFSFEGEEHDGASAAANAHDGASNNAEKVVGRFRRQVTW